MTYTQPLECEKCGVPIDQDNNIFCPDCRVPEPAECANCGNVLRQVGSGFTACSCTEGEIS